MGVCVCVPSGPLCALSMIMIITSTSSNKNKERERRKKGKYEKSYKSEIFHKRERERMEKVESYANASSAQFGKSENECSTAKAHE